VPRAAACALAAWLAGVVPAAAQVAPAGPTGAITGTVVLSPSVTARRPRVRVYADFGPGSVPAPAPRINEMANVVVYLDSTGWRPGPADRSAPSPAIVQRNEAFVPHVLAITVGTRVEFPNDDPFFHNVFSLSQAMTFDLGRYPQGQTKSVVFDRAGIVQVFCHIHADMSAIVLVRDNPFFVTPDSTGRFTLSGIAPGTYTAVGWHERASPLRRTARVVAGEAVRVDFSIPVSDSPRPQ
jgi:plastocyanin